MPLKARRMKGLRIDEASGVDAPAHLAPGWMVLKSAAGGDPLEGLSDAELADVIKALETTEGEPVEELIATLTKSLGTLPEPAKASANALIAALGGGAGDDPVAKAVADTLAKAQTERDEAIAAKTVAEEALAKSTGSGETEEEALAKAMATLPEPVRKQLAAQQERIAKAETDAAEAVKKAETERDARVSAEYLTKARGPEYSGLPAKAEVLATILREVDDAVAKELVSKTAGDELHRILKAASHLATGGAGDFTVFGGEGADVSSAAGAQSGIEKAADEVLKAEPTLTRAQAIVKAADANPDLARVAQPGGDA
jgi:hypothetical protein